MPALRSPADSGLTRCALRIVLSLLCALPLIASAQETSAPDLISTSGLATSGLRVLLSLMLVLGLFAAAAWGMRRWRERYQSSAGPIEVISGLSLGSKDRVVLLRVGTEQVLVGMSPAGMRRLHVLGENADAGSFRRQLEAAE